ncbi:UNVERIFIED_CONTAM: hypothetical protein FKN15_006865, partial [Acipenser sinensis]
DVTKLTPLSPEIISRQATINIGTIGHVAHGKSTVVKAISGVHTVRFKNELERNITIKLGYANAKVYKLHDPSCPRPECYRSCGSSTPDEFPTDLPGTKGNFKLVRHVSFVDCPGHDILMATMLNGAAVMDAALLLIAGNESCPQPQTSEHLAAIEIMKLKHILILQNKIDLVKESQAKEQYEQILAFVQGTVAEGAPIIPISAQLKYNIEVVCEYIVKKIPVPVRDFTSEPRLIVIRSFDVNKPGCEVDDLKGGVAGGSILKGVLKVGQEIEVRPGIVSKDHEGKLMCKPIFSKIVSLFAEHNDLLYGAPGGLIGVGTKIDPTLCRADRMVGQVLGAVGALPEIFTELEISYFLLRRLLGVRTEGDKKAAKVQKLSKNEVLMVNIGSLSTGGRVSAVKADLAKIVLTNPVCTEVQKLSKNEVLMVNIGSLSTGGRVSAVKADLAKIVLTNPVCTEDAIEDVVAEYVHAGPQAEESETVLIPEGVLDTDVTTEVSLDPCPVPEDALSPQVIASAQEDPLESQSMHLTEVGGVERVAHAVSSQADIPVDELQVDVVPEEVLVTNCSSEAVIDANGIPVEDQASCRDYLMISLDETGKIVHDENGEMSMDPGMSENDDPSKEDSAEVIKVYIFKADSGEDDLGGTVDIEESENDNGVVELLHQAGIGCASREKMVYMTVNDSQQEDLNVADIADEVYMEVVVGGEEAVAHEREYDSSALSKDYMPVAWAAAYGHDESEAVENRHGAASALLHIDDSVNTEKLGKQKSKKRKRGDTRQFQTVDETGKIVHDENGEMSMDPGMSENDDPSKEDSAEVIKVYIFKADSGEDDLGGTVDIEESENDNGVVELLHQAGIGCASREKMVYMTVNDSQQEDLNVADIADEVYMEVVVGGEEAVAHEREYDSSALSKDYMPVAWAAAYG